jgi:hypothetical protein
LSNLNTPSGRAFPVNGLHVTEVTEPDGGKTTFAYTGVRGGVAAALSTVVTDARNFVESYQFNSYGAATQVTGCPVHSADISDFHQ